MNISKLAVCSLMTALVITLEISVALLGESFVLLTVLSTIPIYIAVRTSSLYGVIAYFCTALLLFFVSPHQAMFFVCTNGLVGITLGVCRNNGLKSFPTCAAGAFFLLIGLFVVCIFLGILQNVLNSFTLIIFCVLFCIFYTLFCNWLLEKIYSKYMVIRSV